MGKQLIARFDLARDRDPQTYAIGIKELWDIDPSKHQAGLVVHSAGWPLDAHTYGGSFLYHAENNQVSVGFVVGLGYRNPYLSPFEEFQRLKTHPAIYAFLEGGKRVAYGARSITAGGPQSLPRLTFPGGALIGCEAGFLNAARIKGTHGALVSGVLAGAAAFDAVAAGRSGDELLAYPQALEGSWLREDLHATRNFKPWMDKGLYLGTLMFGIDQVLLRGRAPWTLHRSTPDHLKLLPAAQCDPIAYPKPDAKRTFDRLSSVFLSNTNHEENQPSHLTLKDAAVPVSVKSGALRRTGVALLPGRRLRVPQAAGRHRSAADQCAELCPLQDLRYQGSHAKYCLGRTRRRRWTTLPQYVIGSLPICAPRCCGAAWSRTVLRARSFDCLPCAAPHGTTLPLMCPRLDTVGKLPGRYIRACALGNSRAGSARSGFLVE